MKSLSSSSLSGMLASSNFCCPIDLRAAAPAGRTGFFPFLAFLSPASKSDGSSSSSVSGTTKRDLPLPLDAGNSGFLKTCSSGAKEAIDDNSESSLLIFSMSSSSSESCTSSKLNLEAILAFFLGGPAYSSSCRRRASASSASCCGFVPELKRLRLPLVNARLPLTETSGVTARLVAGVSSAGPSRLSEPEDAEAGLLVEVAPAMAIFAADVIAMGMTTLTSVYVDRGAIWTASCGLWSGWSGVACFVEERRVVHESG